MTQRTCSSCGARVALLDDRCGACGSDPDLSRVETGVGVTWGRSTDRPRRRWGPVVAVGAAVWATVAFLAGSPSEDEPAGGEDRTSTTRAEATTATATTAPPEATTTAEVVPGGPLPGEPPGLHLVSVNYSTLALSHLIDLDTGEVTRFSVRVVGVTERGLLVLDRGGLLVWPAPYDGSSSTTIVTTPEYGGVDEAWVIGDGTLVWLLQRPDNVSVPMTPATATLVDLDGRALAHFDIRDDFWPAGAVDGGLVISGPGGIYLIDTDGAAERISTGDVVAVTDNRVYAFGCDERLECGLEVLDGRGRRLEVRAVEGSTSGLGGAVAAPDGRIAYVVYRGPFASGNQVAVDGVPVFEAPALDGGPPDTPTVGGLAWSPDGRWLAIPAIDGIHLIDTLGGAAPVLLEVGNSTNGYLLLFSTTD